MFEFFKILIRFLNEHNIPYMLSGSVAMSLYTLPRSTRDFDFVVQIDPENIGLFATHFSEGYYCDTESIRDAVHHKSMFNIIDYASGFKADFIVLKDEIFRKTEFDRRIQTSFLDIPIWIVTKEDLILSKLIWIQDYQSPIQMQDIITLTETGDYDKEYVNQWIEKLSLKTFNLFQQ